MQFSELLEQTAERREVVNLVLEERLFNLVGILQKITQPLTRASIPYEIVGGVGGAHLR